MSTAATQSSTSLPRSRAPRRVTFTRGDVHRKQSEGNASTTASTTTAARKPHVTSSPWTKKLILTLDGGGIRGYSSLIILRALMNEIAIIEKKHDPKALSSAHSTIIPAHQIPAAVYKEGVYLPCHYVDYIAGTSFGGLIAIMLGMLSMSVDECIAEFHRQNKAIPLANNLPNPIIDLTLLRRRTTWPTKKSLSFFNTFAQFSAISTARTAHPASPASTSSSSSEASAQFRKHSSQCQTLAWCSEVDGGSIERPYAFCSYEEHDFTTEQQSESMVSIAEVAKAITAPWSSSFKPFKLGSGYFVDGSRRIRDPTLEVLKEITALVETGSSSSNDEPAIDLLVSLGTDEHRAWFYEKLRGENLNGLAAEKEFGQHKARCKEYHRFEVPGIRLGLRRRDFLAEIEEVTEKWLLGQRAQITKYAGMLVRRRQDRAKTTRWETFALGARYYCFHEGCEQSAQTYEDRGVFFDHLDRKHKLTKMAARKEANIEEELDKGRKFEDPGSS